MVRSRPKSNSRRNSPPVRRRRRSKEQGRSLRLESLEKRELLAAQVAPSWQAEGPFSATDGQVENIVPNDEIVGAMHTVIAHPTDPDILYAGGTNGGVWKTTDATSTRPSWTPLTDDMPGLSIGAMTFDVADATTDTVYAGVGRFSSYGRIGSQRVGILRTTDGGANFEVVDGNGLLRGKNISGIYVNGSTIVVSVNTADIFDPNNLGIFRSVDGGQTFSQVSVGNGGGVTGLPAGASFDLFNDPTDPDVLYTAMVYSNGFAGGQVGVYKSVNQGANWSKVSDGNIDALIDDGLTNLTGTSNLEIAVGYHDNVYVSIINAGRMEGIFRSGDGGATWIEMDRPSTNEGGTDYGLNPGGGKGPAPGSLPEDLASGQGAIHFSMVADPNDPFIIYAGGDRQPRNNEAGGAGPTWPNSIGAFDFTGRLFRGDASQPLNSQWVHLTHSSALGPNGGGTASSSAPHADSREMVFDAAGNIIEVDDGGIYRRTLPQSNQGDWFSLIGDLQVTEAHDVAYDSVSNIVVTGNQDTGTTRQPTEDATIWESVSTADGGDVAVDDISLAGSGQSIHYSSFQNLGAFRKRTYNADGSLFDQVFPALQVISGQPFVGAFRTPVEINPFNPDRLIIQGRFGVYESFDQGETIAELPVVGGVNAGVPGIRQNPISVGGVVGGVVNEEHLWVGANQNLLRRTAAGGVLTPVNDPPVATIRDLVANPSDADTVVVVDPNQVAISEDAGTTWTDITGDLLTQVQELYSLAFLDTQFLDAIMVGTNLGVYVSAVAAPGTWIPLGANLPNVPVFDMELDTTDDILVAGTLGRGAWSFADATQSIINTLLPSSGPELIAIRPDADKLLLEGDTLFVPPREFNLLFNGDANLAESTINTDTIKLVRAGHDDRFGDANDVEVALGYVGLLEQGSTDPADLTHIVIRPASVASHNSMDAANMFPDDLYQIQIIGSGDNPLQNRLGQAFNAGEDEQRTFRLDRGAQVVSVVPQPVNRNTQLLDLGGPTGGSYTLTLDGETTTSLLHNASNTLIENALLALSNVQAGDITVSPSGEVHFRGQFAGEQVPLLTVNSSLVGGNPTVTRLTKLTHETNQIVLYFDDQVMDAAQVVDPAYYRVVDTQTTLTLNDDNTILPESVTYDSETNKVVLTFADPIPEGTYRLDVGDSGGDNSALGGAVKVGTLFAGNNYINNGFLGDTGGSSADSSDVDHYNVELSAAGSLDVMIMPHDSALNLNVRLLDVDGAELLSLNVGPGVVTNISQALGAGTYFVEISSADGSTGSYTFDATVMGVAVSGDDDNSQFITATDLGNLGAAGVTVNAQIEPQPVLIPPRLGGQDEPGHRSIQREQHIGAFGTTPTLPAAVTTIRYYFPDTLGTDFSGVDYPNLITEREKQIVREIFEIYAKHSGYEFIETPETVHRADQLMIGKGDMRAVDPTLGPGTVAGQAGGDYAVLDGSIFSQNQANRFYGDGFTDVMFHEIGHAIGLGHSYDLPSVQGGPFPLPNDVMPGDHDILHLQRIVPPNATDIDMYRFDLTEAGRLRAETIAERLATPSLLNTALTVYRAIKDDDGIIVDYELVARNDQYYGTDSFIDLQLEAGTYYVGVSSTGNTQYDPRVPDSGYGGTTDGAYDLKISFEANRDGALEDARGTVMDGDGDGRPGGVYSFYFQSNDPDTTIYIDKVEDTLANVVEGSGTIDSPYDTIEFALTQAGNRIVVPTDGATSISVGDDFFVDDGTNVTTFRFGTSGLAPIVLTGATDANDVATRIEAAIVNARTNGRLLGTVGVSVSGRVVQLTSIDKLDVSGAETLLETPNLVRIVGNGGPDGDLGTLEDNLPYLLGIDQNEDPLPDGREFLVPQGVNVMIHAGALLKMQKTNIDAGTSSTNISRAASSIQVLGTPTHSVFLRSVRDDTVGGDSDGISPLPDDGDFGGIVFREDSDLEQLGIFLNYVNHADILHGGGKVFVDADEIVHTPVHIVDARPTVTFNKITSSDDAAFSASPDSFDDVLDRIGPDVYGNFLVDNAIDGLFIRVLTPLGANIDKLTVNGRFNDTDITHVLTENLIINGGAGGPTINTSGFLEARPSGRLVVDPGTIVKLSNSRIEAERGAAYVIAEGTRNEPIVMSSIGDDRYGGSGSFDTDRRFADAAPSDWGGLFFSHNTSGSIANAIIAYGGGATSVEGGSANFNPIEIHQADQVRVTNSFFQFNASGNASGNRNGRGANQAATIYVRGSQPVIVENVMMDNSGSAININANSLRSENMRDPGRTRGVADPYDQFADNHGPLVRLNELDNNSTNGMTVRGEILTTKSVWDDTDIVHVLNGEVIVEGLHHFGGLRLQSSNSESLIIKVNGANSGFTATDLHVDPNDNVVNGPTEIVDRIGGTLHVLGTVGHPVVITHIADDSTGAGFTPDGLLQTNTNNSASPSTGVSGGWRGLLLDEYSNDRNVAIVRELEDPLTIGLDINGTPGKSQLIGIMAPDQKSGDENRRLGFEVHGFISPDDPTDVDVYSFTGTAGSSVWIDIDRTDPNLDAIIEVINAAGTVVERSVRSQDEDFAANPNALTQEVILGGDHHTQNFRDPGLHYVLPGDIGEPGKYFVRVRSNPASAGDITSMAGESRGHYQLQVRLDQVQEFPGSTVQFADIRYASTGIDVRGLPAHSPMIGEAGELPLGNESYGAAQNLINLLESDMAALGISGELANQNDVDWYSFDVLQTGVQVIPGVNDGSGTIAITIDVDYTDNAVRADSTVALYDENMNLIYLGRESDIQDDNTTDITDLAAGSLGKKDPFIGPIHVVPGSRYYLAMMSDRTLPQQAMQVFQATPGSEANKLVRLEPVHSVVRVVEDHIRIDGLQGYISGTAFPNISLIEPETTDGLFDITDGAGIDASVDPFNFEDVVLYIATDSPEDNLGNGSTEHLVTADPFSTKHYLTRVTDNGGLVGGVNDIQDIVIRSDGRMFGYQRLNDNVETNPNATYGRHSGALVELDPSTGNIISTVNDNIPGGNPTPNTSAYPGTFGRELRSDQFTTTDEVDALTFRRRSPNQLGNTPNYQLYYSVREADNSSKLYLATADGDADLRNANNARRGFIGDIQPAGVEYATRFIRTRRPVDGPDPVDDIRIQSKIPGVAGNFSIVFTQHTNNTTPFVNLIQTNPNVIEIDIGRTGNPVNNASTSGAIVNAINNDPVVSNLVTAVLYQGSSNGVGNGNAAGNVAGIITSEITRTGTDPTRSGSDGTEGGPLDGHVTGLAFGNFTGDTQLFGVTNAGEFLIINQNNGVVEERIDAANAIGVPGLGFQGLALGPQNVEGGNYSDTLFAVTDDGRLVAFDNDGFGFFAFEAGDPAQVLRTGPGAEDVFDRFFTLSTDASPLGPTTNFFTTDPISVDAPSTVSVLETQSVEPIGYTGTFTLSLVDDQGEITSPTVGINPGDLSFVVEDASTFPPAPFIIQVQNERMRVNTVVGNTFNVTRAIQGTTLDSHPHTSTVFEIVETRTTTALNLPATSLVATGINDTTTSLTVTSTAGFPAAPFTIRVEDEEMTVNSVVLNVLNVTRGANGTTAASHEAGELVTVGDDALSVLDAIPLQPSLPGTFNLRINNEDLRVVGVVGNNFTVIRGINGTTPAVHPVGSVVHRLDTTAPITVGPVADTNAAVEAALNALQSVSGAASVIAGALPGPFTVEFDNPLKGRDLQEMTGDPANLVGDEIQTITFDATIVGGTFRLSFNGFSTGDIAWNASAAVVRAALEALPSIGTDNVLVTRTFLNGGPIDVQFTGALQDTNVALMQVPSEALLRNPIQQLSLAGATGGDFTLTVPGFGSTGAIAFNATVAQVESELDNIPGINVNITGGNLPGGTMTIEFLGGPNAPQMTFVDNLTPATANVVVSVVRNNNGPPPIILQTRVGTPVSVPVTTNADGVLSVLDALQETLVSAPFVPGDLRAAGFLPEPAPGVAINFLGNYAGVTVDEFVIDNFLNFPPDSNLPSDDDAYITLVDAVGPGSPGSFIMDPGVEGLPNNAIGLAFSPLDFNLWHPSERRGTNTGHGINAAPDDTRAAVEGGFSYQFGLERWVPNNQPYLNYDGVNAQHGILTAAFHADLSSNPLIRNSSFGGDNTGTYNLPGGAFGTLSTMPFDLTDSTEFDRPTLYFNYYLETEAHGGSNEDSDGNNPFRDSARAFISTDGGLSWDLLASNNSRLSSADPTRRDLEGELPGFLSHLSDAGLNSLTPRARANQNAQELFDNTGTWRQARVDLSDYAGMSGLSLRFDFSTAGSINDDTLGRMLDPGRIDGQFTYTTGAGAANTDNSEYGEFVSDTRSIRSVNNQFEGFYVDDIIIGYAERGEMATGTNADARTANLFAGGARTRDNDPGQLPDVLDGPYQVEVRRTDEFILAPGGAPPVVAATFQTNDRHINNTTETAFITFEPSTFIPTWTPTDVTLSGVTIPSFLISPWSVTGNNPYVGVQSLESGFVSDFVPFSIFQATPADLGSTNDEAGVIRFTLDVSSAVDTHGLRFFIDGVLQPILFGSSGESTLPNVSLASGETGFQTVEFRFGSGNPTFTWMYDFSDDTSPPAGDNRAFIDNIQLLQGGTGLVADPNRERPQGVLILESNFITDSAVRGINVQPGTVQGAGGGVPHPGSTINFPQQNTDRYVPGIVIENNVIAGSSGIRFAGEATQNPQRPVPLGRIVNNTIVGVDRNGIGIDVDNLASPTLMNNLLTNLFVGIDDGGVGTVIRSNFFQNNGNNGATGNNDIQAGVAEPLFEDAVNGNYYLRDGSRAIDSSQDTEQDRFNFVTFKTELGIPPSPIQAPDRDVFGQLRISSGSGGGGGATVFKDRGAVDRADSEQPYADLLNPLDNDVLFMDIDRNDTVVQLTDPLLSNFTILLGDGPGQNSPFQGTGVNKLTVDDPNDDTVSTQAVKIFQNNTQLVEDVHYRLSYDEVTGVLLLTPISTLWDPTAVYVIELDNTQIADDASNFLRANQPDGSTKFTIIGSFVEVDYGDAGEYTPAVFAETLPSQTDVFAPNVLTFEFEDVPVDATGDATLTIDVEADLASDSEFLTIDIEGLITEDVFTPGTGSGTEFDPFSTSLTIPLAELRQLTADETITVTVTPSADVSDIPGETSSLTLGLTYDWQFWVDTYNTSSANDGARHTMVNDDSPRFGHYVDGERDSQGPNTDDIDVAVSADGNIREIGDGPFTITNSTDVTVQLVGSPVAGDNIAITAGSRTVVFELVEEGGTPAIGRVPVVYPNGSTFTEIMDLLSDSMSTELLARNVLATVTHTVGTDTLTLTGQDDEDGIGIEPWDVGGMDIDGFFVDPVTGDFLSFLNPQAVNGAELVINTIGGGLLDAWVDFDGDGDFFDAGEQVLFSEPVFNGENRLQILTPPSPGALGSANKAITWARFRLSTEGGRLPTGVAVDGEVEDYRVFIADTPLPEPNDDNYTIDEDPLTDFTEFVGVNDDITSLSPMPDNVKYILEESTMFGTLTLNDMTGEFTYRPEIDFYGNDFFTYRLTGTQEVDGMMLPVRSSKIGTVNITVNPINDPPHAFDLEVTTTEPTDTNTATSLTITNSALLAGALPQIDALERDNPWHELEQELSIIQISVLDDSGTYIPLVEQTSLNVLGDASQFVDETTFRIATADGSVEYIFEFDNNLGLADGFLSPNIPVDIFSLSTDEEVRDAIFDAINDPNIIAALSIVPEKIGTTGIQLGGRNDLDVDTSAVVALDTSVDSTVLVDGTYVGTNHISDGSGGHVVSSFVRVTVETGEVTIVEYQPAEDYNEYNPSDGGGPSVDEIQFTVSDDGATTLPDGSPADPQPAPETVNKLIKVTVRAQNDLPTANDDTITSDVAEMNPLFAADELKEDVDFVIPTQFLLSNDFAGRSDDDDESLAINGHDGAVSLVTMQGAVQTFDLGPVNSGIAVNDFAFGSGYIMWSEEDVFIRFAGDPPSSFFGAENSANMVAVRFTGFNWEYNTDVNWVPFVPEPTDRLLAEVDFTFDTITSLQYAFGTVNGIEQGFVDGDLTFDANTFNGLADEGEFTIGGTFFDVSIDPDFPTGFRPFPIMTAAGGTVELVGNDLEYKGPTDFFGTDSFEYFIVDQGIDVAIDGTSTPHVKYDVATVTLIIDPMNDDPLASDQFFTTPERQQLTITAEELIEDSIGHANPSDDLNFFPFNESNQDDPVFPSTDPSSTIVMIKGAGGEEITKDNLDNSTVTLPVDTGFGQIIEANFDANGNLIDLVYEPKDNFNVDNPLTGSDRTIDSFEFTLADNGVHYTPLFDRLTTDPAFDDATAFIAVLPRNNPPVLQDDLITATDPTWLQFSNQVPMEDTLLTIPAAFLFDNDANAPFDPGGPPASADDELNLTNDSANLTLEPISFTTDLGGTVTLLPSGDLTYLAPPDVFGLDTFVYEASDMGIDEDEFGIRTINPQSSQATVSILVEPVNDPPTSFDRSFAGTEDDPISFDADDLLLASPVALPINSNPVPAVPYDESEQSLRIVAFADADEFVDVNDLVDPGNNNDGDGILTLNTVSGGVVTLNFTDGAFVDGTYQPGPDYNMRTPFAASELFSYIVADDGITTIPGSGIVDGSGTDTTVDLDDERSLPINVTVTISHENDPPQFDFMEEVNVLERDDNGVTIVGGWATNVFPGPTTALDELQRETVRFTYLPGASTVPAGLFRQDPTISSTGALSVFPNPDQIGSAVIGVLVEDVDPTPGFVPFQSTISFTLNVRPVNDEPRIDPTVIGTSDSQSVDLGYSINDDGELTITLPEDNTGADGETAPFVLPMRAAGGGGFEIPGLLDLFEVGPDHEQADELGGLQFLELSNFPTTTAMGGTLTPIRDINDVITSLEYTPPADYNSDIGDADSFIYEVIDKSGNGDETWSIGADGLVPDRLTATNRVFLNLNPVNDAPVFQVAVDEFEVSEADANTSLQVINGFASGVAAGPLGTATDETDPINGQNLTFELLPTNFPLAQMGEFFSTRPTITSSGALEYLPAPDAFGQFEFNIVLSDDGAMNLPRGDINASAPVPLTIHVRPINDPPAVTPLVFDTLEDNVLRIPASGSAAPGDLLGSFMPGPANEAADIDPGGNQTLMIDSNFPTATAAGGTLTPVLDDNDVITDYDYTPPLNYVGDDSFIYQIIDDGQTVLLGFDGVPTDDPKAEIVTVTLRVMPVNDEPVFAGADNVAVDEDSGPVTISDWATGVGPGPTGADGAADELIGATAQEVTVGINFVSGDAGLFAAGPTVTLIGTSVDLSFEPVADANGSAIYRVTFTDDGPTNAGIGDDNQSEREFTITVNPVNDPPTFTAGSEIVIPEDNGAYSEPWASDISPGPGEEATTQTIDRFEVKVPEGSEALFDVLPQISNDGVLTFTPADDASGQLDLEVTLIDSEGGRSEPVAILPLTIIESDDPPVANDDLLDSDEDNVLVIDVADLLANDVDPDLLTNPGEELTIIMPAQFLSERGALVTYDEAAGEITYDPRVSEELQALTPTDLAEDRFSYRLTDANGEATLPEADVILAIQGINDAPMLMDDDPFVAKDGSLVLDLLSNDNDVDGTIDPASIVITLQPTEGALSVDENGVVTYVAKPGYEGTDIFRYTVADDLGQQSQQATVVVSVGVPPEANDDVSGTFLENPVFIEVLDNDLGDLDPTSIIIETPPTNGEAIPQADGTIRYLPDDGYLGPDSLEYSVADNGGRRSGPANVDLLVVESNLQNPVSFFDVNASGTITSLDALLIINKLSQSGGQTSIPVDPDARGPNFYDVNGDLKVSGLDALLVINQLAMQQNAPEPEQVRISDVQAIVGPQRDDSPEESETVQPVSTIEASVDKLVSEAAIIQHVSEAIDVIVQEPDDEQATGEAVDAALTDLL